MKTLVLPSAHRCIELGILWLIYLFVYLFLPQSRSSTCLRRIFEKIGIYQESSIWKKLHVQTWFSLYFVFAQI